MSSPVAKGYSVDRLLNRTLSQRQVDIAVEAFLNLTANSVHWQVHHSINQAGILYLKSGEQTVSRYMSQSPLTSGILS